ncbi:MAG: hypothetical protein Q4F41_20380 [Eubacteriales bacterium]|nr:hypothetical protein [Eubacteriales bacterium]
MAVAITNMGQMLFLYRIDGTETSFSDDYSLHWTAPELPWLLKSGGLTYQFQLPDNILRLWLENSSSELERKQEALRCKADYFSNMVVYHADHGRPIIHMISINQEQLYLAMEHLHH